MPKASFRAKRGIPAVALALLACGAPAPSPPQNVIQIEIDDHGLSGLWDANAPNLKGLIARGTFAYSRVQEPTHSSQGNFSTLTGQDPDGNDVPANSPLDRPGLTQVVSVEQGIGLGDYALYTENPLRTRGDSVYAAAERLGIRPSYFGQLPPEDGATDDVHFTVLGADPFGFTVNVPTADLLLEGILLYPQDYLETNVHIDGPPNLGEDYTHFTIRDAAQFILSNPMPRYMYVWDFIALDSDPTSVFGAEISQVIEDYDDAIGDLLDALDQTGQLASTNIVFTLDHGKVDTEYQAVLGTHGTNAQQGPADGTLGELVAAEGAELGLDGGSYVLENEDGDALIYANTPGCGTAAGAGLQESVTHALVDLIQQGKLPGVDTTRTATFDGYLGTQRFHDLRNEGPHQADILVFAAPDWDLAQIDPTNSVPGPFLQHTRYPFGRHGGLSTEELYVPLILSGPAFKSGVMLPCPVNQDDVAPTAMWALGAGFMTTSEGAPIFAAFQGQPGETLPQPVDMSSSQAAVLAGGGCGSQTFVPPLGTVSSAVVVDVDGLYYDEVMTDQDPSLRSAAQPFLDLAALGTVFDHDWLRYRDVPVNAFELLTGGYPVRLDWIPFAEDDPAQQGPPGMGLLAMPVPAGFVADPAGYSAWHEAADFDVPTLLDAASETGFVTALLGQTSDHDAHIDTSLIDLYEQLDPGSVAPALQAFLVSHPKAVAIVAIGGTRTSDRHSSAAASELAALGQAVSAIASVTPDSLLLVTSRGATAIDDPAPDYYGPQTSKHVPLIAVGPNVRQGVITSQPAEAADIPATVLTALGVPLRTDLATCTWAAGSAVGGIAQPTPAGATGGRALTQMFAE